MIKSLNVAKRLSYVLIPYFDLQTLLWFSNVSASIGFANLRWECGLLC